jgi:hypothetical protein
MMPIDYEATLRAAERLLAAGPFGQLDLWERLGPQLQREIIETLADRPSFEQALEAARLTGCDICSNPLDEICHDCREYLRRERHRSAGGVTQPGDA